MLQIPFTETERLILRRWTTKDHEPFAAMNSDPRVMEYFPKLLSRDESDMMVCRIEEHFDRNGFGLWAMESKDNGDFLGFTGLAIPSFEAEFTPCVEIGWRLAYPHWGKGYVTEAARSALKCAFTKFAISEIVSFTVPANLRSRAVMQRLGMSHDPNENFEHPKLPEGHPLRRHVLYRLRNHEGQR